MNTKNYSTHIVVIIIAVAVITLVALTMRAPSGGSLPPSGETEISTEKSTETTTSAPAPKAQSKSTSKTNTSATPSIPVNTVSYTNDGFSPANLSVVVGTTVTFVNQSSSALRISTYDVSTADSFSQPRSVGFGEIFLYTFTDTGAVTFRNLNRPEHTGSIVVLP